MDAQSEALEERSHNLLQEIKKVGPDLKEVRQKLHKEWIPYWLAHTTEFRPTTKMPQFRLPQEEVQAISAFIWQDSLTGPALDRAARQRRARQSAARIARLPGMPLDWRRIERGRRHVCREPEPRRRKRKLRLPGPLGPQPAPAHAAVLPVREERPRPGRLRQAQSAVRFRPRPLALPERRPRTGGAAAHGHAQPAAHDGRLPRHRQLSDHAEACRCDLRSRQTTWTIRKLAEKGKDLVRHYGCAGCHEISGLEDEGRIGTELTNEGSKPIERLDFALWTEDAKRGILPDGKPIVRDGTSAWFDPKGFFEQKLKNPAIFDQGKYHANPMDALRMPKPNLQSQDEVDALVTMLLGSTDPTLPPDYMYKPADRRRYIQDGWWIVTKYNCIGCHQIDVGQKSVLMTLPMYQGENKANLPPVLTTEGARVNPDWLRQFLANPALSTTDTNRNGVRQYLQVRMPTFSLVRRRNPQAGAILRGDVAATRAVHSAEGAAAQRRGASHGAQACSPAPRRLA